MSSAPSHPNPAIMIALKLHKKHADADESAREGGDVEAMQELMDALKSGDAEAALAAFKSLNALCGGSEE